MPYAFTFDASSCTGCKACQVACKDKNNLPTGVLWRRVYEVTGGTWIDVGAPGVWQTDVFAYNLSIACNHCVHPKCAGVCPVDAYVVRDDGIVYIDETKCMGCGYCSWACPYAAPQYSPDLRHMTKCNFCFDNVDAGLPPACVAACPMRVLDFTTVDEEPQTVGNGRLMVGDQSSTVHGSGFQILWDAPASNHPFPLPENSRTEPHLAIKPHAGMVNGLEKTISNQEEVKPQRQSNLSELPLVIFTLLVQMAAGIAFFALFDGPLTPSMLAVIAGLIALSGLVSFLHLGAPWNAWRALNHLEKSWLSREILMFGLFGMSFLVVLAFPGMGKLPLALTGVGLVYSMARVYRLRAVLAWNSWRTNVGFFLSAGILGLAAGRPGFLLLALLAGQLVLVLSAGKNAHRWANRIRVALIVAGMVGVGVMLLPGELHSRMSILIFLIVLAEEIIGRWQFYAGRTSRM